ncbi:hypothetical protein [Paenibacillus sinopodophylli]|uniref:hypothetical protein n=1 Tax=Paenibacillus sinopodophylli TaxID=1837342 RepID=UPI00110CE5DC|nr:hypothetical protein [Paenibacillus sinopodophylli]
MNKLHMSREVLSLLDQGHQELQLDALRELHRSKVSQLLELNETVKEMEIEIKHRRAELEKTKNKNYDLEHMLESDKQIVKRQEQIVKYEKEYSNRQLYYIQASENVDSSLFGFESFLLKNKDRTNIVVVPDGIKFKSNRMSELLQSLSERGFLCIAFNGSLENGLAENVNGYYEFKDEALLLKWLNKYKITPIVLCTWVLQSAWYDLLISKRIWYDICEEEDFLWGIDASARLKHYEILKQAEVVTYSDFKRKKHTLARKDALLLTINNVNSLVSKLS